MSAEFQKLEVPSSVLGEGPVWSTRDQCLYYVDIMSRRVQAYWPETKRHEYWQFDEYTGCLAECESGGLIVALTSRVVWFDPKKGLASLQEVARLEVPEGYRLNDGKVDPWGRFWVGTMHLRETDALGKLWCITPAGNVSQELAGIVVANCLAFDRERKYIYFADSPTKIIRRGAFDAARSLMGWEPFTKATKGYPDGSCTDAEGYLWNAEWLGWRVVRHSPSGQVDRVLKMPVSRPSCCTFGGPELKTLFVTSARYNMTEQELAEDLDTGSLYAIELDDVRGLPADLFGR